MNGGDVTEATGRRAGATGIVLLTLASGQFLMALDTSVMNVSIATVAKDIGTTVTGIQTAITLYTLVMASLMITGGKLGQILGRKRAFSIGCVVYACGSFTTSLAPNLTVLIIGWSLLEGLGAVLIMPAIVALVASNFGRSERPRAYGLVAAAGAIAVALGPLIGGAFTTYASWRWVFAGEVVVVLVILALTRRMNDTPAEAGVHLDLGGTVLSALGLGLVVLRHPPLGHVGLRAAQARSTRVVRALTGHLVDLRRRCDPDPVHRVGEPAHRARRRRAHRPRDAAQRPTALRGHVVPVPVPHPGRPLLRRSAVLVGRARAVGDCDGRSAASVVADVAPRRARYPQAVAECVAAAGHPSRVHDTVRRPRAPGRLARRGRRPGDRDLAADPRRARDRRNGVAARKRDRVRGARRAERRGRWAPEHGHPARRVDRHRARRAPCSSPR